MRGNSNFKILILFLLSFTIFLQYQNSEAKIQCESYLSPEVIMYENRNHISFTDVEVFRRNNEFGPQQNGLIKFVKWSELTFEFANDLLIEDIEKEDPSEKIIKPVKRPEPVSSTIGITEDGRIFHLIRFNNRTIARLLSGTSKFIDFQVSNKGRVLAWNEKGESFFYSAALWMTSPKKLILKRWFKLWGLTSLGAVSLKMIFIGGYYFPIEAFGYNFNFPMLELFFSSATAMSSGFAMLSKYEHENTYPNGFVKIPDKLESTSWIKNQNYLNLFNMNLENFDPPKLDLLAPKLNTEFTESIR